MNDLIKIATIFPTDKGPLEVYGTIEHDEEINMYIVMFDEPVKVKNGDLIEFNLENIWGEI